MANRTLQGEATQELKWPAAPPPLPTVLLRHELPDGSHHVDWLSATDAGGAAPLLSFRLPHRLDELAPGQSCRVEHIGDHRPLYLDYEGPVSADRGQVRRLNRGQITRITVTRQPESIRLQIIWEQPSAACQLNQELHLSREHGTQWKAVCVSMV